MLKTTRSLNVLELEIRNSNGEVVRFGIVGGGKKLAKKSRKLKGQNLVKSQKLSKSGKSKSEKSKKLSKSENSINFDATEAEQSFLTSEARTTFNHL